MEACSQWPLATVKSIILPNNLWETKINVQKSKSPKVLQGPYQLILMNVSPKHYSLDTDVFRNNFFGWEKA